MRFTIAAALAATLLAMPLAAQDAPAPAAPARPAAAPAGPPQPTPLGRGPWDYDTQTGKVHVEVVARQLERPWAIAFVPGGDMLVTERPGRLRLIHAGGKLDPVALAGLPPINPAGIGGLFDIALDPDFAKNRRLFLSYVKPDPDDTDRTTLAVLSATWDGGLSLKDVKDVFVADAWYGAAPIPQRCCGQGPASGSHGGRIEFGPDGKLYVTSGDRNYGEMVQKPDNHFGKILRLNPDGSVPKDNPFVGKAGWKPEIWTLGHRNPLGLTLDAQGRFWETEFGPRGGDELNLIEKGQNYGWIDVTQGFHYNGEPAKGIKGVAGMADPVIAFGPPSLNPGNPVWYGGPMFAGWRGNLLLPSFTKGLLRIAFDEDGKPGAIEELFGDLKQRMRDASVAPDGSLYILTDEIGGAVLRVSAAP